MLTASEEEAMQASGRARPAFSRLVHVGAPNIGSRARFHELVDGVLDANWLTNDGPLVRRLEATLATYLGVRECVAVCNGTVALEIAVRCLGLAGEVIVPSLTFVASASALEWLGVRPVFCDVDPETYCIDPDAVEELVSPRTSGILGVHLFGRPCDVEALSEIAARHRLSLFFDAAHAFGCSSRGRMIGNFGACEVFSFHATKFFNTIEGGAIATNDPELAHRARLARNFGYEDGEVRGLGINGKMNEICAAMGISNFESLQKFIDCNKHNHDMYRAALATVPGLRVAEYDEAEKNNHQYVVVEVLPECAQTRDQIMQVLRENNVLARSYFSPGCHCVEPHCSNLVGEPRLPHTVALCDRLLILPTGTCVSSEDIITIAALVRDAAQGTA